MTAKYVCGFLFCEGQVLLVRKKLPQWQNGLWNGVGGKIETIEHRSLPNPHSDGASTLSVEAESPLDAMVREFSEEAQIAVPKAAWSQFCLESGAPDYEVHFFRATVPLASGSKPPKPPTPAGNATTWLNDAEEIMAWHRVPYLLNHSPQKMVGNLRWLLPMAMDWRMDLMALVSTNQDIRRKPSW